MVKIRIEKEIDCDEKYCCNMAESGCCEHEDSYSPFCRLFDVMCEMDTTGCMQLRCQRCLDAEVKP
jgi:hypothetical protein